MVVNPCFCAGSLKRATLILSLIGMILALVSAIFILISGWSVLTYVKKVKDKDDEGNENGGDDDDKIPVGALIGVLKLVIIYGIIICILQFLIAFLLFKASNQEDYRKARTWLIINIVLIILILIGILVGTTQGNTQWYEYSIPVIRIVYMVFSLWVVWEFMKELKLKEAEESRRGPAPAPVGAIGMV